VTARVPLIGASGYDGFWNRRARIAAESGLDVATVEHLLGRHGSDVTALLDLCADRPDLARPIVPGSPYLAAEARYAATHEAALHLDDVLTRRMRLSIETFDRGTAAAPAVAALMAEVLGWDDATVDRELRHYAARVQAERESQTEPDDETADAARLGAADVRRAGDDGAA
jgi:glycerol-3-phosphate dehydrogenase